MKVLIIGGCGYVGSAIGKYLTDKHEVTNVDLEWFGNHSYAHTINMDYNDSVSYTHLTLPTNREV